MFQKLPKLNRRLPKILRVAEHHPRTSEDFRKLPKIAKDGPKVFEIYQKHYKHFQKSPKDSYCRPLILWVIQFLCNFFSCTGILLTVIIQFFSFNLGLIYTLEFFTHLSGLTNLRFLKSTLVQNSTRNRIIICT